MPDFCSRCQPRARWALHLGLALALVFAAVASLAPAAADAQGAFLNSLNRFESRAYNIYTNLSRAEAVEYGRHMDLIYRAYTRQFRQLRGGQREKQDMYLLRTRRDYIRAMGEFGINASASGGMFFWNNTMTGMSTWVEGVPRDYVFATLQHEGFHQFAHHKLGDELPLWVNEGLAEYFGAAIIVDGDVRTGIIDKERVDTIRAAFADGTALGFVELLETDMARWHHNMRTGSPKGSLQYDQSWALVHFLIHGDKGKYRSGFGRYLVLLSNGRDHAQAFREVFGDNTGRFARRWARFIETAETDHYSLALKRLQFLGAGLLHLHRTSAADPPTDVDALRAALRASEFEVASLTDAGPKTTAASDETLYAYEDKNGDPHPFELLPAEEGSRLPPTLRAGELRPVPTLTWARDDEDNLRAEVAYSRR